MHTHLRTYIHTHIRNGTRSPFCVIILMLIEFSLSCCWYDTLLKKTVFQFHSLQVYCDTFLVGVDLCVYFLLGFCLAELRQILCLMSRIHKATWVHKNIISTMWNAWSILGVIHYLWLFKVLSEPLLQCMLQAGQVVDHNFCDWVGAPVSHAVA